MRLACYIRFRPRLGLQLTDFRNERYGDGKGCGDRAVQRNTVQIFDVNLERGMKCPNLYVHNVSTCNNLGLLLLVCNGE